MSNDEETRPSHTGAYLAGGLVIVALILIGVGLFLYFHYSSSGEVNAPANPGTSNHSGVAGPVKNGFGISPGSGSNKSNNSGGNNATGNNSGAGNSNGSGNNSNSGSTSNSGNSNNGGSTANGQKNSGKNNQQLANTGPGEVVALFIGTVALATLGYRLYAAKAARSK